MKDELKKIMDKDQNEMTPLEYAIWYLAEQESDIAALAAKQLAVFESHGNEYERAHQMFTEFPELWNHQGVIRKYLRLAYLDGEDTTRTALEEARAVIVEQNQLIAETFPKQQKVWLAGARDWLQKYDSPFPAPEEHEA